MWVPTLDSAQAQRSRGILGLEKMVLMISELGLAHHNFVEPFYEPICA